MNIVKLVFANLLRRKGRFTFTLLGITVGMAAFVALLSLGGNMRSEISKQAGMLGANIIIMPKNWCAYDQINILTGESLPETLPYGVLEKVSAVEGVTAIPYLAQKTAINNSPVSVTGILPFETQSFKGWEIEEGRYFDAPDERTAVLGSGIAEQFQIKSGGAITIRGETFPVIGILKATGSNDDIAVYLPVSVVQEIYDVEGYVSFLAAKVDDMTKIEPYTAAILDAANVVVSTDKQLLGYVLTILGSVNITLQAIAGVALAAAAFGIVNTMMTAIYERRREIGILRAIGGKSTAIFKIFLLESGLYGLLGGIAGVIAGYAASLIAAPVIAQSDFTALLKGAAPAASLNAAIVFKAVLFSLAVSVASGIYPALKAAKLTPAEAVSYE